LFDFSAFFEKPIYNTGTQNFFSDALPNTVIAYAAPSIACHTLTALGINKQYEFYAMRIATLLAFMLMAIFTARVHRDVFIAMSPMPIIPMVINQSVATGADQFSLAACMLAAAVIVSGARNSNLSMALTASALFLLLNTKTAYLVFALPFAWMLIKNGIFS